MAQFIITYSAWTIGGALLGGLYYVLWGGSGPIEGYMVSGAILGYIGRFLIKEL